MNALMKRWLAMALCLLMIGTMPVLSMAEEAPAAEDAGEESALTSEDLTPEERAQWQEWLVTEEQSSDDANVENAEELTAEEEAAMAELAEAMQENAPMDEVDISNLEPNEKLPANVFNILLLGVDNRSTDLERGLSDAVIICSVNLDTGSVKLTSIARDTAVTIPGFKSKNRINVAYKRGGPELSIKTVNRNFHMNIEKYVVVNIHGLADIIDALGGVDMEMTAKEASRINFELRKEPMDKVAREKVPGIDGMQHLDGMQAVTFARIRGIDNDLERTRRQRQLLQTLLAQVMENMDLTKFLKLVDTALPHGDTNLTLAELVQLATAVLSGEAMENMKNGGEILQQLRIPMDKRFGYRKFGDASLIYLSDKNLKLSIEAIHELIYGQAYLMD